MENTNTNARKAATPEQIAFKYKNLKDWNILELSGEIHLYCKSVLEFAQSRPATLDKGQVAISHTKEALFDYVEERLKENIADLLDDEEMEVWQAIGLVKDPVSREESELHCRMAKSALEEYKKTMLSESLSEQPAFHPAIEHINIDSNAPVGTVNLVNKIVEKAIESEQPEAKETISIEEKADMWWDWGLSSWKKKQLREKYFPGHKSLLPEQKVCIYNSEFQRPTESEQVEKLKAGISELMRKQEVQIDAFKTILNHPETTDKSEIDKISAVTRFLKTFYSDLEALNSLKQ